MLGLSHPSNLNGAIACLSVFAVLAKAEFILTDAQIQGCVLDMNNVCGCSSSSRTHVIAPGYGKHTFCEQLAADKVPSVTLSVFGCPGSATINFNPPTPSLGYPISYLTNNHECGMACELPHVEQLREDETKSKESTRCP